MHAPIDDDRLRHVPPERWERARLQLARHWLREARVQGNQALASFSGLIGVRTRVDLATLASRCDCGGAPPCEHALAVLLHLAPRASPSPPPKVLPAAAPTRTAAPLVAPPADAAPPPQPPAPRAPDVHLLLSLDASDPGRLLLEAPAGGALPEPAAEALRWVWWRRDAQERLVGDAATLPQALQLLAARGLRVGAARSGASLADARASFHQRALGEAIHVQVEAPASDAGLALAGSLHARGAAPFPGEMPPRLWTLPAQAGFASWFLASWAEGAEVAPDLSLNPKPLKGVEILLDPGCLPARLKEAGAERALASDAVRASLARLLGDVEEDAANGHVLVPATRVVDVEEGLRALGADVTIRRLAPAGARHLQWSEQLPEDFTGARPRLREPFRGALDARPPGLKENVELASYQEDAVAFIRHHDHTCLLADDMGLGKTLEAIAAALWLPGRVLVVCPASARDVWRREVAKFTTASAVVLGPGADPALIEGDAKFVVTGYSNLEALGDAIRPESFDLVILDESHYVKNAGTGRAKLVKDRLGRVPRRLVVSGTPVMNTPDEIRAQLAFLHPEEWSDAAWFKRRFAEPFEQGTPEVREAVLRRLRQFLEGVMIRREKATALPELPPKAILWHRVKLPGEARRAYVALEEEFHAFVAAEGVACLSGAKAGGKIERLKQTALAGKLPEALAFLRGVIEGGEKVVVFSRYRNVLTSVAKELAPYGPVVLHGETPPEERAEAERRFQEDPACRVFLGQLVAAGTALTLIAGTHAVFLDLDWNPANHRQAMDRIHRRGQTRPVTAHFFLAEGTVDEDVAQVLDEKGQMMDALLSPTGNGKGELKGARRLVGERLLARRGEAPSPSTP